ncbi:MAG: hypothetical protein ACXAB7_10265 [Candidatus Kariarchaeaceae archaeon]|jgi:tellurite resistance protein
MSLEDILDQLMAVAQKDGVISEEEKVLIKRFMSDAEKYTKVLDEALSDGIIDKSEQSKLLQYRLNIANKAKRIAQEDAQISLEEKDLMLAFHKILVNLEAGHEKH